MDTILRHLAQAAAFLLFLEFFILLLIVVALCGGTAFGLHWGRGKLGWVFGKVNEQLPRAKGYVHRGTDLVARPFILAEGLSAMVRGTAQSIRRSVQTSRRASPPAAEEAPAEPANTLV